MAIIIKTFIDTTGIDKIISNLEKNIIIERSANELIKDLRPVSNRRTGELKKSYRLMKEPRSIAIRFKFYGFYHLSYKNYFLKAEAIKKISGNIREFL